MEWFSTISLTLGSAWTSGINLYATVTVLGLLQKFGWAKLPGGLDVLDNWWIIGVAGFLYLVEFFADKIPYVDSIWDVVHTFIRVPAGVIVAYAATYQLDPGIYIPAALLGGGLAFSSHGTKAALGRCELLTRAGLELDPVDRRRHHRIRRNSAVGLRTGNYRDRPRRLCDLLPLVFPEGNSRAATYVSLYRRLLSWARVGQRPR